MKSPRNRKPQRRRAQIAYTGAAHSKFQHELLEPRQLLAAHIVGSPTVYSTIQAAVNAAAAGATITVDPGTYPELVTISKSLTLKGAEAGVDARSNTREQLPSTSESILTGALTSSGTYTSGILVNANDVTIDGFTVQGQTSASSYGAGIVIAPNKSGTKILNNILQNNMAGIDLANNSSTDACVIQYNVFRNNNQNGDNGGRGIYTDASVSGGNLTNVTIDSNYFTHNFGGTGTTTLEAAIALQSYTQNSQSNIRITNNSFDSNGKTVLAWNVSNLTITGNYSTYNRDETSGALRFEGGINTTTITGNSFYDDPGTVIKIDNKAVPYDNKTITITGNDFYHNAQDTTNPTPGGMYIGAKQYVGTLNASNNYWGSASGPGGDYPGTGDAIVANAIPVTIAPFATTPPVTEEAPYWGTPSVAGSPIEAEDYDHGGEGVAYHDSGANNDGSVYRPFEGVDLESTTDTSGNYDVTSTVAGEYLNYTVNISQAGTYNFSFRVASGQTTPGTFHIEVDGVNVSGPISIPNTGGPTTWLTFTKTGVTLPAGQHVMKIAFDTNGSDGNEGKWNWFEFTYAGAATVPSAPTNLAAQPVTSSQINLTWTNTANNQSGFDIFRSLDGTTFTQIATNVTATNYSDSNLSASTPYYYEVTAINTAGSSADSNIANATTLAATTTPVYLSDLAWQSATVGYGTIHRDASINGNTITLNGVTYTKGLGVHAVSQVVYALNGQYNTFISDVGIDDEEDNSGTGSVIFEVIGDNGAVLYNSGVMTNTSATQHIALNITGVQTLTLLATNGVPNSIDYDHADWAGAYVLGTPVVPAAPTLQSAIADSSSSVTINWTNNATNQTGFTIERSLDGITFTPAGTVGAAATSITDNGLTASTPYTYEVLATNAAGSSAPSNTMGITTLPASSTPVYLSDLNWVSATAGYGTVQKDKTINGNTITLNGVTYTKGIGTHAVSQIVYALNGQYSTFVSDVGIDDEVDSGGTGHVEFKVLGDNGAVLFDSGVMTNTSPTQHISISVAGVQTLTLIAINGVSGIDYDHSDWAGAYLLGSPSKPASPSNLVALASSSSEIDLAWTNNATDQTGFLIERSTDGGTTWATAATVGSAVNSYQDKGLLAGTAYTYRVSATNSAGNSSPSNLYTATTFAANATPVYLSDLNWVSATAGYGTVQKDTTIKGNTITLRGTTYAKGIGTHAASDIVYQLNGQYTTFLSDIGIDDEVNGNGSVIFRVFGDGNLLYQSGTLTGTSPINSINISVAGVQQLTLEVVSSIPGTIDYDHSDWAGARLIPKTT